MSSLSRLNAAMAMAALIALATPALAGEHEITAQEVESYLQEVQREATEIMRAKELGRMVELLDRHFADGAVLQASMNIMHGDERKGFLAITLDKQDLLRVGGMLVGAFRQMEVEEFSLNVEVLNVAPHGPGAATVTTRWTERFAVALPTKPDTPKPEQLAFEEVFDCTQILHRNGKRMQMGLMTCIGEMRL
jgi:hypothetical protein